MATGLGSRPTFSCSRPSRRRSPGQRLARRARIAPERRGGPERAGEVDHADQDQNRLHEPGEHECDQEYEHRHARVNGEPRVWKELLASESDVEVGDDEHQHTGDADPDLLGRRQAEDTEQEVRYEYEEHSETGEIPAEHDE